jgi:hypothetical protein
MRYLLYAIFIVAFISMLGTGNAAYTVSLTGSCPSGQIITNTSNTLIFNLTSTGNYNPSGQLYVNISGAATANQPIELNYIKQGPIPITLPLSDLSVPGEYVGTFDYEYMQGGHTLFAVFPCIYYIYKEDASSLFITNVSVKRLTYGVDSAKVNLTNFGSTQINAEVYAFYPFDFNVSPSVMNITIPPKSTILENFTIKPISTPSINGTFSMGFYAAYLSGSMHYSTQPYVFTFLDAPPPVSGPLLIYGVIAVVATIVALILISLRINRNRLQVR